MHLFTREEVAEIVLAVIDRAFASRETIDRTLDEFESKMYTDVLSPAPPPPGMLTFADRRDTVIRASDSVSGPGGPPVLTTLAHVARDEPLFLLRGQDAAAPNAIRQWGWLARRTGASSEKVRGALDVALAMEAWQKDHGAKAPD